mgnify:CR=1 FL=1
MSKANIFDGEAPKDVSELKDLASLPPTVIWKTDDILDEEKITSKIVRKSPTDEEWKFFIDCKSEGKLDQLVFTISKEDNEWISKIDKSTSLYSDIGNNISELLENFKMSTFGSAAEFKEKYSAEYEKGILSEVKSKIKNDDIDNPDSPKKTSIRFKVK